MTYRLTSAWYAVVASGQAKVMHLYVHAYGVVSSFVEIITVEKFVTAQYRYQLFIASSDRVVQHVLRGCGCSGSGSIASGSSVHARIMSTKRRMMIWGV
jgi:hypothetical protein